MPGIILSYIPYVFYILHYPKAIASSTRAAVVGLEVVVFQLLQRESKAKTMENSHL